MGKIEIIQENRVFDKYFKVDEAIVEHTIDDKVFRYSRLKLDRPDAVIVLLYNKERDTVVLVKQFRYPAAQKTKNLREPGFIIEVIAGKIDLDESSKDAALREVEEETGYILKEKDLIPLNWGFATPGYSSERIYQYAAVVTNKNKKNKGGGKEDEYEDIEVIEMPYLEFRAFVENGNLIDMKTRLAYFDASNAGIFKPKKITTKSLKETKRTIDDSTQLKFF
jgi:ADP-ribose pyrophosphatase